MYKLTQVDFQKYVSTENCIKFLEYKRSDKYWLLFIADKLYGFGVDSNIMIDPLLVDFETNGIIFIGIHDSIMAFSLEHGDLMFFSGLKDPFTTVEKVKLGYLIITETTMLKINQHNFSIDKLISIPDVIEHYQISDNKLTIKGLEGEVFEEPL